MFANETPENIMEMSLDDVLALVKDDPDCKLPSPNIRLNYIKMLYDVLGYSLTPDVALASVSAAQNQLIIAPAGGGKTTLEQIKAVQMKLIMPNKRGNGKLSGDAILCLVYNTHNVADMKQKHKDLVTRVKMAVKGTDFLDDRINAYTMHSFCEFWRKQYVAQLNLIGYTLLEDDESLAMMSRSIRIASKLLNATYEVSEKNMLAFYNLCKESLKTPDQMVNTDKFQDLKLPIDFVETCFTRYEASKNLKHKYDYTDMLTKVYCLLRDNESVRKNVQKYYEYVIADEVQDFTPLMWKILALLVDNGTPLTCIGDEDQLIYSFRGAEINELLHFSTNFPGGKVFTSTQNRRCRKAIIDEAKFAIGENKLRFNKQIFGIKDGGSVELIPYNSIDGQIINVVERIKKMDPDDQHKSVICFREQSGALLLTDLLEENGIPFHSLQGTKPFSHELYRHVLDVLNALDMAYERRYCLNLYKVLPCKKSEIFTIFGFDHEKRRFSRDEKHKHFAEYDYGKVMSFSGFEKTLKRLIEISVNIDKLPMSSYINELIDLIKKYFWDYKKSLNAQKSSQSFDDIFEERVRKYFYTNKTFSEFSEAHSRKLRICSNNNEIKAGVTVSTFHGLKGLEYDHVYVLFMDDDVFPNFDLIRSRQYPKEIEQQLMESETRLWYVTITRAIDDLHIYYAKDNPSRYVTRILQRNSKSLQEIKSSSNESPDRFNDDLFSSDDFDFSELDDSEGSSEQSTNASSNETDDFAFDELDDFESFDLSAAQISEEDHNSASEADSDNFILEEKSEINENVSQDETSSTLTMNLFQDKKPETNLNPFLAQVLQNLEQET